MAVDDLMAAGIWTLILCGALVFVPFAYRRRGDNRKGYRAVLWAALLYLALQVALYIHIYGQLRFENRDWLHALFVPIFLGLVLPFIWFLTGKRED